MPSYKDNCASLPGLRTSPPARVGRLSKEYYQDRKTPRARKQVGFEAGGPAASPSFLRRQKTSSFVRKKRRETALQVELEIKEMRKIIRKQGRGIIHPRTAKWLQWWDAVSFACLLFTASVTPFEVTLLPSVALQALPSQPQHLGLFLVNRLVDLFFLADLCLNFFMAYRAWTTAPNPPLRSSAPCS